MAKVLVIDDEPSIGALVAEIVESYGHEVTVAYNGRQGLELIKSGVFKMIISDIMMPYINGRDLLDFVRADKRLAKTCFVLMSAVSHLVHLEHKVAADAFIVKPFDINVIDKLITTFLNEKPGLEDGIPASFSFINTTPLRNRQPQYMMR